ncbi:MAG: disulfide bond formation protein DsbA [Desulfosporosinus sp. BRH_c37]|nr:MAG: disulfide bond formation protein DsbA [Desulfosporosinus sp. BRH_c37]
MIGKVPLDQLAKDNNLSIEWKAFELRPEGIELPEKSPKYLARAKAGIEALGRKYGFVMIFNDKSKHSRLALEGAKFAEDHGLVNEYHDVVFAAQFQKQENINDINVLTELAVQIGLDQEEFRKALATRTYEEAVLRDVDEAHRLGIHIVPCYIVDDRAVYGAQSYETLEKLLQGKGNGFPLNIDLIT